MKEFDYDSYQGSYQYDALKSRWPIKSFWHKGKLHLINSITTINSSDIILDFGCGSGNLCIHLTDKCAKIFGVDKKKDSISS